MASGPPHHRSCLIPLPFWLQRLDPDLRDLGENLPFLAFADRRANHHIGVASRARALALPVVLAFMVIFGWGTAIFPQVLGVFVANLRRPVFFGTIGSILLVAGVLLYRMLRRRADAAVALPFTASGAFSLMSLPPELARDFWLAGWDGASLARAVYGEAWIKWWRFCMHAILLLTAGLGILLWRLWAVQSPDLLAYGWRMALAAVLLALGLVLFGQLVCTLVADARRSMLLKFINYPLFHLDGFIGAILGLASMGVCFAVGLFLRTLAAPAFLLPWRVGLGVGRPDMVEAASALVLFAFGVLGNAVWLAAAAGLVRRWSIRRTEEYFARYVQEELGVRDGL